MDAQAQTTQKGSLRAFNLFSTWQWLSILGGLVMTSMGLCAFAFTTFQTEKDADKIDASIERRLDRIENKIDQTNQMILQWRK